MAREKMARMLAKAVQRMAVHVWAAEKGLVAERDADGHEAELDDHLFVEDMPDAWEGKDADPFASAFDDLLEAPMPEQGKNDWGDQHEDPDPWNDDASWPPQRAASIGEPNEEPMRLPSQRGDTRPEETTNCGWYKRLAKYKANAQRIAAFYPLDQPEEVFEVTIDTSRYLSDVDVYNDVHAKAAKKSGTRVNYEWIEPIIWRIGEFQWTQEYKCGDGMENKRGRSCTFLELACAIDILTGGMCGPKDASIKEKTDITKQICNIIHGSFKLKGKFRRSMNSPQLRR
jgi:hypothetical protein